MVLPRNGEAHYVAPFATGAGLRVEQIEASGPAATLLIDDGLDLLLWHQSDASPRVVRRDPLGAERGLAAVDEAHFMGVGPGGTVNLLSLDNRPPAGGACDGLERFLRRTYGEVPPIASPTLVVALGLADGRCRQAVARGEAPALAALAREWTAQPDPRRSELGRLVSCAIRDRPALEAIPRWQDDQGQTLARSVCIAALQTWPGADEVRRKVFDGLVRRGVTGWQVDPALLALLDADDDPMLRDELVPVVRTAQAQRAAGLDRLHEAVCARTDRASSQRASLCTAPNDWSPSPNRRRDDNNLALRRLTLDLVATAAVGGLVAGSYLTRDSQASRVIATGSAALGGAVVGMGIGTALGYLHYAIGSRGTTNATPYLIAGAIVGGSLGGWAGYAASAAPTSRPWVTALGLAIPYGVILVLPLD